MRANRVDKHHRAIAECLVSLGCSVQSLTAVKNGCPDLLVGMNGKMVLVEVKTGSKKPREDQRAWHASWRGPRVIVLSADEDAAPIDILKLCYDVTDNILKVVK